MRARMRLAAGAVAAPALAAAGVVGVAAPAGADAFGDELLVDIDGNGLVDRVLLAEPADGQDCAVVVSPGRPGGGYFPAVVHRWHLPGDFPPNGDCPELGRAIDLGGDGDLELVVAWWLGWDAMPALVILDRFQPAGTVEDGIRWPSTLDEADFNGDGLPDLYSWTDQGDGIATYLNTPEGGLVPGPIQLREVAPSSPPVVADFDEDGAADMAIAFLEGFPGPQSGVTVILDDGTRVDLRGDESYWTAEVADTNGDGHLDVVTTDTATGEVATFLGNGDGTFVHPK